MKDGKYIIAPETGHWKVVTNQDTILPNDLDASVSLTFQKAEDPGYGSGLVFWAKDYNDYYVLALTPGGSFEVQHYIGKRWLQPIPWRQIDNARKGENVENILRVVTKGNTATAYVNDKEIISFTGEPPQGGSLIGFKGSSGPKGVNAAAFANLKVIGPSQALVFQPDPKQPDTIRLSTAPLPSPDKPLVKLSATEYYNKGSETKDPDQKIEFYTKAIEINPYNPQYNYYRGLAYKSKALFPLALEDFNKAINYQPNYPSAYLSRGDTYAEMGQQDAAIADYTKALSLESRNTSALLNRGNAYMKKGVNDKAIEDYSEAIRLKPNLPKAFNNRGVIFYRKGENEKALADYNEAIRLDPNYVLALRNRANSYERMGDLDRAAADRKKANSLDPKGLVRGF